MRAEPLKPLGLMVRRPKAVSNHELSKPHPELVERCGLNFGLFSILLDHQAAWLQKRIDEAQAIDNEAVLHVFGVKLAAAEGERRRHDGAIPIEGNSGHNLRS